MGQKVHPHGIRLGINKDWSSKWYADSKNYSKYLFEDIQIREYLTKELSSAAVSDIVIERPARNAKIIITSARPGVIIGKKGGDIEKLKSHISRMIKMPVHITIQENRKPDLNALLVAENIARQLEKRVMFRRAMKRAIQNTMRAGAEGVKISIGGRLGGAEIARTEWSKEGRIPLHTFRADIDYATSRALTTYGIIGVKVWIYKGEKNEVSSHSTDSVIEE